MKRRTTTLTLLLSLALLGACSGDPAMEEEPRLDLTGTQADFQRSQDDIRDSLVEDRREIFDEAMRILYFNASSLRGSGTLSESQAEALLIQQLHESTAGQVVEEALRTFREFCVDNELSDEECQSSISSAGLDTW